MNIVFFTPATKASAIGRMASMVTKVLIQKGHELTVVRTEDKSYLESETHDFSVGTIPWTNTAKIKSKAQKSDLLVYHIGNSHLMHRGCIEWLPKLTGVVCLHDYFLGHLFTEWSGSQHDRAINILQTWYGERISHQFFKYTSTEDFIEGTREEAPMTEWVSSLASAVLTHSSWGIESVLNSCPGPVYITPLAYNTQEFTPDCLVNPLPKTDNFTVLTIGHMNSNKRLESVIQAIGSSKQLYKNVIYKLVGPIEESMKQKLLALAEKQQVRLEVCGKVDDLTLGQAIEQSDVLCCLRWPILEAASASAIEAMLYGKPVIVTDAGFYRELPSDCVIKINHKSEVQDLQKSLELLYCNRKQCMEIGVKAKEWASKAFTAENYALKLLEIGAQTIKASPILKAIENFSDILFSWGGTDVDFLSEDTFSLVQTLFEDTHSVSSLR